MSGCAELTVGGVYDGRAAWIVDRPADQPAVDEELVQLVQPGIAFLSALGGGLMLLPLADD